jgi:hypothetical protein
MNKTVALLAFAVLCLPLPANAQTSVGGPEECAALRNLQLPGLAPCYARYSGRGDQNDAASFACQAP